MSITLSPQDYATAFHLLSKTSRHAENIQQWFERRLLARLPARPTLLDVGAGTGQVARRLSSHFAALTLLEPNPDQLGAFDVPGARLLHTPLEKFDSREQYDVVLCSHMLYHVPVTGWSGFIDRLLTRVRPGGFCVFVLSAAHGPNYELHRDFNPTVISGELLKHVLREKSLAYESDFAENGFLANTFEEMYTLCRFLVFENCFTAEQLAALSEEEARALEARIRAHAERCRSADGLYHLRQDDDLVLVTRP